MHETVSLVLQVVAIVAPAAAVYGAIRADLKYLREGVQDAKKEAARANQRLDGLLELPRR